MPLNLTDKRIVITGGKGFLGAHLAGRLHQRGCKDIAVADLPDYDLRDLNSIKNMYDKLCPDIVIHLAANVGGIGYNQANPAGLFYDNAIMGIQLIHEAYLRNIEKFVALGTICAYPKFTPVPFNENYIWNGYPEETNAPYGLAKKMMLVQSQAYRKQYGFNSIFLLPVNLYGPGDNFSFKSSHVVPALIRKFHLARLLSAEKFEDIVKDFLHNRDNEAIIDGSKVVIGEYSSHDDILLFLKYYGIFCSSGTLLSPDPLPALPDVTVEIWGTGSATREFFYVEDAAEAICLAAEAYNKSDPVNIGAGFEISIKDLVALVVKLMDYKGRIQWDLSRPDGQPRRMLDTSKAKSEFGFEAKTLFIDGLKKTIEWYVETTGNWQIQSLSQGR